MIKAKTATVTMVAMVFATVAACGDDGKTSSSNGGIVPRAVGASGPMGIMGEAGEAGQTGAMGIPGVDGAMGAMGVVGPAGPAGPAGERGPRGVQGQGGLPGATGSAGIQGVQGPAGPAGGGLTVVLKTSPSSPVHPDSVLGIPIAANYFDRITNASAASYDPTIAGVLIRGSTIPGLQDGDILLGQQIGRMYFSDGNCRDALGVDSAFGGSFANLLIWHPNDLTRTLWKAHPQLSNGTSYGSRFDQGFCSGAGGFSQMMLVYDTGAKLDVGNSFPWVYTVSPAQ